TAIGVEGKDEVGDRRRSVWGQLASDVLGGPEADDLQQPAPRGIAASLKGEVGEDQAPAGLDGLRLANDVPVGCEALEVAGEALFEAAVEAARARRGGDRIARCDAEPPVLPGG